MTVEAMRALGGRAQLAAETLAVAKGQDKDRALRAAADLLEDRRAEVLSANAGDLERAGTAGASAAVIDRLRLSDDRLRAMAAGLRAVAALPDPVGETIGGWVRPNGLEIRQVRVPLGVIGIIYENRPNVTSDAAGLCLKSGNSVLLRGSSTAIASNTAITELLREGVTKVGLPADSILLVDDTTRESAVQFMQLKGVIDCLIPRGGRSLIQAIEEHASVPYIIDGDGNCHVYVDAAADLDMARCLVVNGKMQRPSVCNATESLVVHEAVASRFLPELADSLVGVELVGDDRARRLIGEWRVAEASPQDYGAEFLDLKLSIRVVDTLDEAIAHIRRFGSGHSEAIVTEDRGAAARFCREVDAAAVLVNVSTRFVDGEEFGFGAEIGISTQKLHARGPMGLRQLTTSKYLVVGDGQTRN